MTTFGIRGVTQARADPNHAALVRQNLELNGITGQALEAAIGPNEGTARFDPSELSNLGRLSDDGSLSVPMISDQEVCVSFALIKIDIEGGEQGLFDGPTGWLARADAIIIEFHPPVDHLRIAGVVSSHGFKYIPAHSLFPENMDCFTRVTASASACSS